MRWFLIWSNSQNCLQSCPQWGHVPRESSLFYLEEAHLLGPIISFSHGFVKFLGLILREVKKINICGWHLIMLCDIYKCVDWHCCDFWTHLCRILLTFCCQRKNDGCMIGVCCARPHIRLNMRGHMKLMSHNAWLTRHPCRYLNAPFCTFHSWSSEFDYSEHLTLNCTKSPAHWCSLSHSSTKLR